MSQQAKAETFRALHKSSEPLILFNTWDVGSTRAVSKAGAKAIATSSWSIAAAQGFGDGEKLSREVLLGVVGQIVASTDLPVTVDLESGYGKDADAVAQTVRMSIEAGVIGCNLEDSDPATGRLRPLDEVIQRIEAARRAATDACPGYFINIRTDVFFQKPAAEHDAAMAQDVIERAKRYAEAGADGLFVPGLTDVPLIRHIASASPLPLNIMRTSDDLVISDLAEAGVARISHGPYPYLVAMSALERVAKVS
ncbi:MAG TPA: isocitrate lyase/phosphoenolpyruvate mutase family protein [Dyella sp.]|uniref:isocitrate lyase/PEP mutase family protein n=1 Tax=Dyella sp. TaxID=1869338 RepID=UPI002F9562CF